jgi:hypothetical protein
MDFMAAKRERFGNSAKLKRWEPKNGQVIKKRTPVSRRPTPIESVKKVLGVLAELCFSDS